MSSDALVWAWAQRGLTPPERLVLLVLADDANHQDQCWPSKLVLAHRTELTEEEVATHLKALESKSAIRREPRPGKPARIFLGRQRLQPVTQLPVRTAISPFAPSPDAAADMEEAQAIWNEMAERTAAGNPKHRLPKAVKLNDALKRALAARLKEFGLDGWRFCVNVVENSAHCRGVNDRGWRADMSYLLQPKGSGKCINGGWPADYEEMTNGGQRTGAPGRGDQLQDGLRSFDAALRGRLAGGDGREGGGEEDCGEPGSSG